MSGGTLRFAANMGLAHMYCETCKEDRLHHKMRCASCKTFFGGRRQYKAGKWNGYAGKLSNLNKVQRAQVMKNRAEATHG